MDQILVKQGSVIQIEGIPFELRDDTVVLGDADDVDHFRDTKAEVLDREQEAG